MKKKYEELLENSLMRMGSCSRMSRAVERFLRGGNLTVAYVGGSITQGVGASLPHKSCYAYESFRQFQAIMKKSYDLSEEQVKRIRFIKAGLAGTGSELCAIRYERDVEREGQKQPDLIIVEFCVNDEEDETRGVFYESLVRRILKRENDPAVILLFCVFQNGFNLQERLYPIGERYDLPVISIKDAVYRQFDTQKEQISKKEFFADPLHPSDSGHSFMAACLSYWFQKALTEIRLNRRASIKAVDDIPCVYGCGMENMKLLDRRSGYQDAVINEGNFNAIDMKLQCTVLDDKEEEIPVFPYNWHLNGDEAEEMGKPFYMKICAQTLTVVLKDSDEEAFGMTSIYVDGKLCRIFDPHIENWTHCHVLLLYENKPGWHEIEILQQPLDFGGKVTILGFGYVI